MTDEADGTSAEWIKMVIPAASRFSHEDSGYAIGRKFAVRWEDFGPDVGLKVEVSYICEEGGVIERILLPWFVMTKGEFRLVCRGFGIPLLG
jgi:hypothetical protein